MRWGLIQGGQVANVIEQDQAPAISGQWVACGNAGPGWAYDGAAFTAPYQVPAVPPAVTMRQGIEVLIEDGLLDATYALIDAIVDPIQRAKARNYLDTSNTMERANPWVITLGAGLGLTPAQIDAMFVRAAAL